MPSEERAVEKELRDEEEEANGTASTPESSEDALGGSTESAYTETSFADLNSGITRESDPSQLTRDKSGAVQDLTIEVDMETPQLPEIEAPAVPDGLSMDFSVDFDDIQL